MHFEYISDAVSHGIMRVGLDTRVPTIFGVLTCLSDEQARERAGIAIGEGKFPYCPPDRAMLKGGNARTLRHLCDCWLASLRAAVRARAV